MTTVLTVEGELTIVAAAEQHARLRAAMQDPAPVEVDLSGVTELDTAGLQLLLAARRDAVLRGRRLTFRAPSPAVRDVFALAHLERVLDDPHAVI